MLRPSLSMTTLSATEPLPVPAPSLAAVLMPGEAGEGLEAAAVRWGREDEVVAALVVTGGVVVV
jgi:hypothetical protein